MLARACEAYEAALGQEEDAMTHSNLGDALASCFRFNDLTLNFSTEFRLNTVLGCLRTVTAGVWLMACTDFIAEKVWS